MHAAIMQHCCMPELHAHMHGPFLQSWLSRFQLLEVQLFKSWVEKESSFFLPSSNLEGFAGGQPLCMLTARRAVSLGHSACPEQNRTEQILHGPFLQSWLSRFQLLEVQYSNLEGFVGGQPLCMLTARCAVLLQVGHSALLSHALMKGKQE
jgi:hypothetical protein